MNISRIILCIQMCMYLFGHSSGKNTLVAAYKSQERYFQRGVYQLQYIPPNPTGIISFAYDSPEFGKILFYDFAGPNVYHPSHAALLEHSKFALPTLFLLIINLMDSFVELKKYVFIATSNIFKFINLFVYRKINYWISFLKTIAYQKGIHPVPCMVVGSHPDKV